MAGCIASADALPVSWAGGAFCFGGGVRKFNELSYANASDPWHKRLLIRAFEDASGRNRPVPIYEAWRLDQATAPETALTRLMERLHVGNIVTFEQLAQPRDRQALTQELYDRVHQLSGRAAPSQDGLPEWLAPKKVRDDGPGAVALGN
jgi:hypothetical protein